MSLLSIDLVDPNVPRRHFQKFLEPVAMVAGDVLRLELPNGQYIEATALGAGLAIGLEFFEDGSVAVVGEGSLAGS